MGMPGSSSSRLPALALVALLAHCAGERKPAEAVGVALPSATTRAESPPIDPLAFSVPEVTRYLESSGAPGERQRALERLAVLARHGRDPELLLSSHQQLLSVLPEGPRRQAALIGLAQGLARLGLNAHRLALLRHLACPSQYVNPTWGDLSEDSLQPVTQDHSKRYWKEWLSQHPVALDQDHRRKDTTPKQRAEASIPMPSAAQSCRMPEEEIAYRSPYTGCAAPGPGTEPAQRELRAWAWLELGRGHSQAQGRGGPYEPNRAAEAYAQALQWAQGLPKLKLQARLGAVETEFHRQRFEAAATQAVALLGWLESWDESLAAPLADRMHTLIAHSVIHRDFFGPAPQDPNAVRPDEMSLGCDLDAIDGLTPVALQRLQDPTIIPRDFPGLPLLYLALVERLERFGLVENALKTVDKYLEKYPLHRLAPRAVREGVSLSTILARFAPEYSKLRAEREALASDYRRRLFEDYGPTSAWSKKHRDDPAALAGAEQARKAF